jgi:glycosyltransferase involved in cell wall biosynthesis
MRVLHLNTHASGGSYEYAMLLCAALAEQGIESRLLFRNSKSLGPGRPFLDRVIRRAYVSLSTSPWHGTRRLLLPPVPEQLREVDVVHLHTVADWFDVPRWLEVLPRRIGVVLSLHDMWHITGGCFLYRGCNQYTNEERYCSSCPILKWPANRLLATVAFSRKLRVYRDCRAHLVANSRWLAGIAGKSQIAQACGGVRVIPPGIDTKIFTPRDKKLCRKQLQLPAAAFVIVTGGASLNDANKNVPWLFEQLSRLPNLGNVIVLVFGEGAVPIPDGLNVRFAGNIRERSDLATLLAAADVFVSASLMETYGLTVVEAMACETPVVALRVGGIPEAAADGQGAILCDPGNGAALREAITKLRESVQLREELGRTGHQIVHSRNASTIFGSKFAKLYTECLGLKPASQAVTAAILT